MSTFSNQCAMDSLSNHKIHHHALKSMDKKNTSSTESSTLESAQTMVMITLSAGKTTQAPTTHGNHGKTSTTPPPIKNSIDNTLRTQTTISLPVQQTQSALQHSTKDLSPDQTGSEDFALRGGAPVMTDLISNTSHRFLSHSPSKHSTFSTELLKHYLFWYIADLSQYFCR